MAGERHAVAQELRKAADHLQAAVELMPEGELHRGWLQATTYAVGRLAEMFERRGGHRAH